MDKNKLIILSLIIIILILALGLFAITDHAKKGTKLKINCNATIYEGDSIEIMLTDLNNTPVSNQKINVTIIDEDGTNNYKSVVTDSKGIGKLELNKTEGNYTINCTYEGNENYTGNTTYKKITVEKEVEQIIVSNSNSGYSQSSSGDSWPDVDSSGITREQADAYGWRYTSEHGGHYIGPMDHWDENAGMYHD